MNVDAHNRQFQRQTGGLRLFCAPSATIGVATSSGIHQLCQVGFAKSDGSIRLEWPYLRIRQGVVGHISFVLDGSTTHYDLAEHGYFTSQLVKLSHHTSGEALFSKTAAVTPAVRRWSFPLKEGVGRVFELHAYWPRGFRRLDRCKPRRVYIVSELPENEHAVVVRGEWLRKTYLKRTLVPRGKSIGPRCAWQHRKLGGIELVTFLAQPLDYPLTDHVLCLTFAFDDLPRNQNEPGLIVMGGYTPHHTLHRDELNLAAITDALIATYPTESSEELVAKVGSIDLP